MCGAAGGGGESGFGAGDGAGAGGIAAYRSLTQRFDATDANDLAAALASIHVSHINHRNDINEDDLRLQVDAILTANAQIASAGGTALDDAILKPMLDNALPQSYAVIRQLVRTANHGSFTAHVSDYMSKVKAELASRRGNQNTHAFATFGSLPDGFSGAGGAGGGGGKGSAKLKCISYRACTYQRIKHQVIECEAMCSLIWWQGC